VEQGDRSGSIYIQSETRVGELLASLWGPDQVRDVEARARGCLRWSEGVGALRLRAAALGVLAMGSTMRGREDEASDLLDELSDVQAHLGMSAIAGEAWSVVEPDVHILREDWVAAEQLLTSHLGLLERIGVPALMMVDMAQLGEVLYRQGRIGQAEELGQRVITTHSNHMDPEIRARKLLGKCLASGGRGGETVAREAVEIAQRTDMINLTADTLCDLTEVLTMEKAPRWRVREPLEEALALYEHKGNVVSGTKVRSWLGAS
jgi:hypothetical protein